MSKHVNKVTAAGLVVALGIIYGDIGTSPLYVFSEIINGKKIEPLLIIGGLSCIIWTLTLQTTIKYVALTLKADNRVRVVSFHYIRWYAGKKNGWSSPP